MYDTTMLPILVRSCETTELTMIHEVFRGTVQHLHARSWQTAYSFLDFPCSFGHTILSSACWKRHYHQLGKNARLWRRLKLKPSLSPSVSGGLKPRLHCEGKQEICFLPLCIAKIEIVIHDAILQPRPMFHYHSQCNFMLWQRALKKVQYCSRVCKSLYKTQPQRLVYAFHKILSRSFTALALKFTPISVIFN